MRSKIIILIIFHSSEIHRQRLGFIWEMVRSGWGCSLHSQMTLVFTLGPAIPLAWIIPNPTLSLVVWFQWNCCMDARLHLARHPERSSPNIEKNIKRLEMFVIKIYFGRTDLVSSILKWKRCAFPHLCLIEILFIQYKTHPFKSVKFVILSIFTKLCNGH